MPNDELIVQRPQGDEITRRLEALKVQDNIVANRALEASLVTGSGAFSERFKAYKQNEGAIVYDEAIQRIMDLNMESRLTDIVDNENIPFDKKVEAIQYEANRVNYQTLSPFDTMLFAVLQQDGGAFVPMEKLERIYQETDTATLTALSNMNRTRQMNAMRMEVDAVAAESGWDSPVDALGEIIVQDFIPIYNIASRIGLTNAMADAAGIELTNWESFWLGSGRQAMRDAFVQMSPDEAQEAVHAMAQELKELQGDALLGPLLTEYNVLEHWSTVFSDDVIDQTGSQDTLDEWLGNFEVAIESLFGVALLAKSSRTIRGLFNKAPRAVNATTAAVTARSGEAYTRLMDMLKQEATAAKFQLAPDEVALAGMPKPTGMIDDIEFAPAGVQQVANEGQRLKGMLLADAEASENIIELADKQRVVKQELEELAEFDGATVHTPMSSIKLLEDGSGIEINAVFGATPTSGWDNIEDVLLEAMYIDPELRRMDIMYVNDAGKLQKLDMTSKEFLDMINYDKVSLSRTGEIMGAEQFFLRYNKQRPWNPFDARFNADNSHINSTLPGITPNARFSDFFYGAFARGALDEQRTIAVLNQIAEPYQSLGVADKKLANGIFEWQEQFGKVQNRNPSYTELSSQFPEANEKVLKGVVAMRNTMDTMYDMLNVRLYREFVSNGYKTVKPLDATMPTFHGKVATRAEDVKPGMFLDPKTGDMVKFSRKDIQDLYASGGSIIEELPLAVATNTPGAKVTRVIARSNEYRVGKLTDRPLKYHPGYTMRFYDDPYYIVRKRKNATIDGAKDPVGGAEAVRTAGTAAEGTSWITRANRAMIKRYGEGADQFELVRASDIDQGESALYQKQVLQQEGRLFYDERNFDRLKNVQGNRAEIDDPGVALERGIHIASRQVATEDLFRSLKKAWSEHYGKDMKSGKLDLNRPGVNLRHIEQELDSMINNAPTKELRDRYWEAREYVKYMRLMEGTNSKAVSATRRMLVDFGQGLHRFLGMGDKRNKFFRAWDKAAGEAEPLRLIRSVAFNLFMKLRPFRQFTMQTMQVGFLTGIDPTYVGTGRVFKDMYAIQLGRTAIREGTDAVITQKKLAKLMGLSVGEYQTLVKQFERSGLIDSVDVHSYTGSTAVKVRPSKLPDNPLSGAAYHGKNIGHSVLDGLGSGFRWGEGNNLAGTYMIALRRHLKRTDTKDLRKLSDEEWKQVRTDASNLALAMIKPNNMRYQTGVMSMATQFLSFQHKATLALLGLNPAMTKTDAVKLWLSGSLLYGAEFVGMGYAVNAMLAQSKMEHVGPMEIPGTNTTVENILTWGLMDTALNKIGSLTSEEWKELDYSFLSPGPNPKRVWEMTAQAMLTTPATAMFGPAASIAERSIGALAFINQTVFPADLPMEDKFVLSLRAMGEGTLPVVNDFFSAWNQQRMGRMFSNMGEPLPLESAWNTVLSRSLLGQRSRAELSYFETTSAMWDIKDNRREFTKQYQDHFQKLFTMYYDREITPESMAQQVSIVAGIIEDIPEEYRAEVIDGIFIETFKDGQPSVVEMVSEELDNGILSSEIRSAIQQMDLPPEEISTLQQMIDEAYQDRVRKTPELHERLTDELKEGY